MSYRDAELLRACMEAESEAARLNASSSTESENTQKFVDPRGLALLQGLDIPEEARYPDD